MTKNRIATLLAATALTGAVMAAPAHAGKIEDLEAQIQMMQEQMAALQQAVMDAKSEASAATNAAKQENAAAVAAVKEDVKKSETKVAEVAKKAASSGSSVKVSGRIFANASTSSIKKDGVKQDASSGLGFDVKRAYVTVEGKLNDTWSANVTTDFQSVNEVENVTTSSSQTGCDDNDLTTPCVVTTTPTLTQGRLTQVYLKKAYVQAKFSDAFTVRFGEADLPWVPYAEGLYGFRYVENTVADRTKFGTSAAWGVHALGKFGNGMVNYAVAVVNNANSYKDMRRNDGVDIEARLGFNPIKDIALGVGVTTGRLGKNVASDASPSENRQAVRWNAIAAYTGHGANVGVEYFNAKNWNIGKTSAEDKAEGFSAFAAYQIDKVKPFIRYDEVKTKKLTSPSLKDKYYNAGVAYSVAKGLDIAAVFKHTDVGTDVTETKTNEFGLWTQVSF